MVGHTESQQIRLGLVLKTGSCKELWKRPDTGYIFFNAEDWTVAVSRDSWAKMWQIPPVHLQVQSYCVYTWC